MGIVHEDAGCAGDLYKRRSLTEYAARAGACRVEDIVMSIASLGHQSDKQLTRLDKA
jgi:hypothetical protein